MPLTWYLISTSHILPSLVLSHCPDHAIVLNSYLYVFSNGDFLYEILSIFCLLINSSFSVLFRVSLKKKTFFHFIFLIFLLTHLDHKKGNNN